jgi:hypothetical protein
LLNIIISAIASALLLLGLVSMVTPIPGGTIMIATSLTALICTSPRARSCLRFMRSRIEWFDKFFFWLEDTVGERIGFIGNALVKTRPFITLDLSNGTESLD